MEIPFAASKTNFNFNSIPMKPYFLFTLLLLQCFLGFAQAPNKMSYQAVIRNSNNSVVSNHAVGMRISILQGSNTGSSVYTETQSPTTNTNGLIAIEIGTGTIVSGSFANIDWANGPYFVKTETDPNGGSNYNLTGTSQLLSVPYALYAKNADTAKVALNGLPSGAQHGQSLTMCDGQLIWATGGLCPAKIEAFNCTDTVHTGTLYNSNAAIYISSSITYLGGNGGVYAAQTISSSGVLGLTAELSAGNLNIGNGSLRFMIKGIPTSSGVAVFTFSIGNKTCTFYRNVMSSPFPVNTVFCNGIPTAIVNLTSPMTGKSWMDRNLGASRAATSNTDTSAYGDYYQWGRGPDGHQCRSSSNTTNLSSLDQPIHSHFIIGTGPDWRSPKNDNLWQGVNGVNNPCPIGYRIPTLNELEAERSSWSQNNGYGAYNSILKFTWVGYRNFGDGLINAMGLGGNYWSSSVNGTLAGTLGFGTISANIDYLMRSYGFSVRCIKD